MSDVIRLKVREGGSELPYYDGDYEVTPKTTETVLPTKSKSMKNDITVAKIPYSDVINESGGHTITIGFE